MAEYIDKEAFIEDIKTEILNLSMDGLKGTRMPHDELYQFIERIKEQPAADVVEVVRCKDCIDHEQFTNDGFLYCNRFDCTVKLDHFCTYSLKETEESK